MSLISVDPGVSSMMGAARGECGVKTGECGVKTGPAQVVLLKGRKTQGAWLTIFYLRFVKR